MRILRIWTWMICASLAACTTPPEIKQALAAPGADFKILASPWTAPPPPGPRMVGVDPALLVAGAAAAGLIGYAIGDHHHHHYYGGPVYYRPVPYGGYYGPRHYYR